MLDTIGWLDKNENDCEAKEPLIIGRCANLERHWSGVEQKNEKLRAMLVYRQTI